MISYGITMLKVGFFERLEGCSTYADQFILDRWKIYYNEYYKDVKKL